MDNGNENQQAKRKADDMEIDKPLRSAPGRPIPGHPAQKVEYQYENTASSSTAVPTYSTNVGYGQAINQGTPNSSSELRSE